MSRTASVAVRTQDVAVVQTPIPGRSSVTPTENVVRQPACPAATRSRCAQLEQWARKQPLDAMAAALSERNLVVREQLRDAVLRGWATVAPEAAADWALRLEPGDRPQALAAVFASATDRPDAAVDLGWRICAAEPGEADVYGNLLISALADRGAYEQATRFASDGPATERATWLNTAFAAWATYEPDRAMASLAGLVDPDQWKASFAGAATGWATADPQGLADYAVRLPSGAARDGALRQALGCWAQRDGVAALAWIDDRPADGAFDAGLAAIATTTDVVAARPDVAIECATTVSDPKLRISLLSMLTQTWAERDRPAASAFVSGMRGLVAEDREALAAGISLTPTK